MFTLVSRGGYVVNNATYEYMCDTKEDLEKIPHNKINQGSIAIVIEEGLKVYMANSKDEWIEV